MTPRGAQGRDAAALLGRQGQPVVFAQQGAIGAEHRGIRQAEACGAVDHSSVRLPPAEGTQLKTSYRLRLPVSPPVGVMAMNVPSADSSSTASGLAWHTRSNCSGVSRRSQGSSSGAGSSSGGRAVAAEGARTIQSSPSPALGPLAPAVSILSAPWRPWGVRPSTCSSAGWISADLRRPTGMSPRISIGLL